MLLKPISFLISGTVYLIIGCSINAENDNPKSVTQSLRAADITTNKFWPQFRGPRGLGVASSARLPTTWNQNENVAWKTPLPGAGASSPIVIGNRIFLTCYSGYGVPGLSQSKIEDLKLEVVCLSRLAGKILWKKTIKPAFPEQPTIRDEHGYSSSTPVADNERLYVFFGKTGVFAFDYDGNEIWQANVGSKLNGWGSAASPIIYDDLLLVNASVESESIVALNRKTGKEVWRAGGIREAWNTPLLTVNPAGDDELIVPIFEKILAFNPKTGAKRWFCETGISWYMVPSAIAKDGIVYCIGGRSGDSLAIRTGGSGDVTKSHRLWKQNKGSNVSSPILHEEHLYWVHDQRGIAYCAKASTGAIVYEKRLPKMDQVYAAPVLADGKLYYVSRSGMTYVIAASPEFQVIATNHLEERGRFNASPAVADNQLFLRSNRFLYCIGKNP